MYNMLRLSTKDERFIHYLRLSGLNNTQIKTYDKITINNFNESI